MAERLKLTHPWPVAVWPGMGSVALSAGYYLLAKLGMHLIAEYEARDLFDVEQVEVKDGIIQAGRLPRNRLFVWTDPRRKHDLVVFLGETQPPIGKYRFCRKLLEYARELGIERVFTFAAMAMVRATSLAWGWSYRPVTSPGTPADVSRKRLGCLPGSPHCRKPPAAVTECARRPPGSADAPRRARATPP
jgi:hypothetical protein